MNHQSNSNRIAKNTVLLYFRSLFVMSVSLYTSRIILNTLGLEDYGIYNVIGGVVAMFTLLSGSLSSAISRYLTFELGRKDSKKLRSIFSTSVAIQITLAFLIVVIAEIAGVWFVNCHINIPAGRLEAANWVLQFSIVTFAIGLISIPYNATIIAHEHMNVFAYISVIEVILKLLVAYLLYISPFDKLIIYALLLVIVSLIIRIIYGAYCKSHFSECGGRFVIDKNIIKEMAGFAGWNFLGSGSYLLMTQGVNILMNLFFTVAVNAAQGIAGQVENVIMGLVNNFTTALNPQITKSYATQNKEHMHQLIYYGSKYSFFLVLLFSLPIVLETEMILRLWLGIVPDYTSRFIRLTLTLSLLSVISTPLVTAMLATGKIKKYQIIVGGTGMLVFPLVYAGYYFGMPPETAYYITFGIFIIQLIYRLILLQAMIGLSPIEFIRKVIIKNFVVTVTAAILPFFLHEYIQIENAFLKLLLVGSVSIVSTLACIYWLGCNQNERAFMANKLTTIKNRLISN